MSEVTLPDLLSTLISANREYLVRFPLICVRDRVMDHDASHGKKDEEEKTIIIMLIVVEVHLQ